MYLVDDDHYHTITSITGFFSCANFCQKCLKHYSNREYHQCNIRLSYAKPTIALKLTHLFNVPVVIWTVGQTNAMKTTKKVPLHKKGTNKGKPSGPSQCQMWWKCPTCYKVVRTDEQKKEAHQCGEYLCSSCNKYVMDDHQCYLR